jgi:putative phosphoesterase
VNAPASPRALRVGLISDTHGLLRPQALAALAGSDCILHAGDIGGPEILERLADIAPVTAVRGNNDIGPWARRLPDTVTVRLGALTALMVHDLADLPDLTGAGVVVCGHSHRPRVERRNGFLLVNPGSAGPRRFRLPVSVGRLHIQADGRCEAELVPLDMA